MRIWLLQTGEPLPLDTTATKMRTALLADELLARGHDVVWWASAFDHLRKQMIFAEDREVRVHARLTIRTLRGIPYRRNVSLARYADHLLVARKFRRAATLAPRPDLVVASSPDYHLAAEGARLARRYGIPVVVDLRDPWPDSFLDVLPPAVVPLARLALAADANKVRVLLRQADGLVAMMEELLQWGLSYSGRIRSWRDRVFYLGGRTTGIQADHVGGPLAELIERCRGRRVIAYVGTFGAYNNPRVVVRAARFLSERVGLRQEYAFVVAGDGVGRMAVRREASDLTNVFFPGWLRDSEVAALLAVSSLAVIPWNRAKPSASGKDFSYAFPNKAFTYLRAGVPVLASAEGDLKHLLAEYDAGMFFRPDDAQDLAQMIAALVDNGDRLDVLSRNARRLFEEKLSAERIYGEYAEFLEAVAVC